MMIQSCRIANLQNPSKEELMTFTKADIIELLSQTGRLEYEEIMKETEKEAKSNGGFLYNSQAQTLTVFTMTKLD